MLGTAAAVTLLVASAVLPVAAQGSDCAIHGTCCFPPRAAPPRWKPSSIAAVFDHVTVGSDGLDRLSVRRALVRQAASIEACFQHGGVGVAVKVGFGITPAGGVIRSAATSSDPKLATCVAAAVVTIRFPMVTDFAWTEVTVTITGRMP